MLGSESMLRNIALIVPSTPGLTNMIATPTPTATNMRLYRNRHGQIGKRMSRASARATTPVREIDIGLATAASTAHTAAARRWARLAANRATWIANGTVIASTALNSM